MNNRINEIANIVLPVVVIVTTIALFFMFKPQDTKPLFWINMFYTVFLEAILFGYFNILQLKSKDFSSPFFVVFGTYCFYYIALGVGCMLVYSLAIRPIFSPDTNKMYLASLMVLTLIWIFLSVITAQTDSNFKQTTDTLKEQGQSLNFYSQKIVLLATRYEKLCEEKGVKYETHSNNRTELDRLKGKMCFLTPNVLKNDTAVAQISTMLSKCEDLIDEMEEASIINAPAVQKKMLRFVDNAVAELDMLKGLTRG